VSGRIVVVGDALLDRDVEGSVERLCPDAPVPVLDEREATARPGGAGLAAALAAASGGPVTLVTALAADPAGAELGRALLEGGVDLVDLRLEGETPEKVRLLDRGRPIARLDRGGAGGRVAAGCAGALRAAFDDAAGILVSDYGRGVAAEPAVRQALAAARAQGLPLVWDPHPCGAKPIPGASLVTPNATEAFALAGAGAPRDDAGQAWLALQLAESWKADAVCVTRGSAGALLAVAGTAASAHRCQPACGDPCGAGDRFAVEAALRLAGGASHEEAVRDAVAAASRFVAAGGARAAGGDLRRARPVGVDAEDIGAAPISIEPALRLAARVRERGGTVVATGGCFDLLHVGHVRTLEAARAFGDCLVVLLNGDRSVRALKGSDRPLVGELERAAMLKALGCVDEVAIFDEPTPLEALRLLRPDVWAKGGDYGIDELPEARELPGWGGRVAILPYVEGRSTTKLIEEVGERAGR
jgi:D-beta-D-heptose 7-phosphate kinase/D-beta-D-heptose 1-phosphate adenosyltransferase